jgi:hypothetical protein
MSKLGSVHLTITELYNNGVEKERIAEITETSFDFVESVILNEKDSEIRELNEFGFEHNSPNLNG